MYPTLLTSIVEPPDGQGNPEAVTTLEYYSVYDGDPATSNAQIKKVHDPNDVATRRHANSHGRGLAEAQQIGAATASPHKIVSNSRQPQTCNAPAGFSGTDTARRLQGGGSAHT